MAELTTGFYCPTCAGRHTTLPLSFSVKAPLPVSAIPSWQIASRVVITPDQCVIDGIHFYLRGRIVIPVRDCHEPFIWGVWAQVSAKNFYRTHQLWSTPGRENESAFVGRLASDLPLFGSTLGMGVDVQTQVVGRRPHITVRSAGHPLGSEQREGITLARVEEIATALLHSAGEEPPPMLLSSSSAS
jgi:hypothetical protein